MGGEWRISLDGRLPMSMNERERASFWTRKRELDQITNEIGWHRIEQRIPTAQGRRYVQVVIHKGARSRKTDDPGNLHARGKAVLDALVRLGLLIDDDSQNLEWGGVVEGEREPVKRTEILIRDSDQLGVAA